MARGAAQRFVAPRAHAPRALVFACALALVACAAERESIVPVGAAPTPVLPEALQWRSPPGLAGVEAAWALGAEKQSAPYVLRVRLAAGVPHVVWARDGAVMYQETGAGPTATAFIAAASQ